MILRLTSHVFAVRCLERCERIWTGRAEEDYVQALRQQVRAEDMQLLHSASYLGFVVGLEASVTEWSRVFPKVSVSFVGSFLNLLRWHVC